MKNINNYKILIAAFALLQSACLKDTGNYEYLTGKSVKIDMGATLFEGIVDEETSITPERIYGESGVTSKDFDHEWYVNEELVSRDSNLSYYGKLPGSHVLTYSMIDKETKVRTVSASVSLRLASPYQNGWAILYEKEGESELGHIRYDNVNKTYITYKDIYKAKHNGESLGSKPIRLKNYPLSGTWSLVVVQQGGQGPVELESYSMRKALVTKQAFVGGTPHNMDAINMGSYPNAHVMVNTDGEVYPRLFSNNPIPFTMPWLNISMQIEKGMRIKALWDTEAMRTYMTFMYDELNNRILYVNLSTPNATGGFISIDSLPSPAANSPYPPDHVNFNRMKDWKYIWGGPFNEAPNSGNGITTDGVVLMQKPGDSNIYLQSFNMRNVNRVVTFTPRLRKLFTGAHLINSESKFVGIKSRNFIFFTGGAANKDLYYYDIITGNAVKLFQSFDSRISAMAQSDNSLELAVGLENGKVFLFNIADAVLAGNGEKELFKLEGLGRIADITPKGGNMR